MTRNDQEKFIVNLHNIPLIDMDYPIGESIIKNIELATKMANYALPIIVENSKTIGNKSINFIVTGSSGAIIGTIFAQIFSTYFQKSSIKLLHIKKERENSHNSFLHKIDFQDHLNIFVDDFIASGSTLLYSITKTREVTNSNFIFDYIIVGRKYFNVDRELIENNRITHNVISTAGGDLTVFNN